MISPTILDVVHLTGLPVVGQHISALLTPQNVDFNIATNISYGSFMKKYQKFGLEPTDEERIAFYLLWLCQFFFCIPSFKVTKEYLSLATGIQEGAELAFAPFLLAILYNGLFTLTTKEIDVNCRVKKQE